MDKEIYDVYEKIKDIITINEFLVKFEALKEEYKEMEFMDDIAVARMLVGQYTGEYIEDIEDNENGKVTIYIDPTDKILNFKLDELRKRNYSTYKIVKEALVYALCKDEFMEIMKN